MPAANMNSDHCGLLFNAIMKRHGLRSNAALARLLGVDVSNISYIRGGRPLSAHMILLIYDKTDLTIEEIRALSGAKPLHGGRNGNDEWRSEGQVDRRSAKR